MVDWWPLAACTIWEQNLNIPLTDWTCRSSSWFVDL